MNYFAKVYLANGSYVEVMGGRTKFFEPGKAQVIKADVINLTLLQQDRQNCFPVYSAVDGSDMLDSECSRRKDALSQQKLSATIEAPSRLVRGKLACRIRLKLELIFVVLCHRVALHHKRSDLLQRDYTNSDLD